MIKAFVIATIGIAVCGAILGCIAVLGVDHLASDDPVPDVLIGSLVFGGGALLVLAIAGRAALRAYRGAAGQGPLSWLAYAVPVLVLIGVVGGVLFGVRVVSQHHDFGDYEASRACGAELGTPLSEPEHARCMDAARTCNRLVRANPPEVARGVDLEEDPSLADLSIHDAAVVRCLRAHGIPR
jgi:hypothetical protein